MKKINNPELYQYISIILVFGALVNNMLGTILLQYSHNSETIKGFALATMGLGAIVLIFPQLVGCILGIISTIMLCFNTVVLRLNPYRPNKRKWKNTCILNLICSIILIIFFAFDVFSETEIFIGALVFNICSYLFIRKCKKEDYYEGALKNNLKKYIKLQYIALLLISISPTIIFPIIFYMHTWNMINFGLLFWIAALITLVVPLGVIVTILIMITQIQNYYED